MPRKQYRCSSGDGKDHRGVGALAGRWEALACGLEWEYVNIGTVSTTFRTFYFQRLYKCLHICSNPFPARENGTRDLSVTVVCNNCGM